MSANLVPRHENRLHRLLTERAKNRYDLTVSARIDSFGLMIAAGFFSVLFSKQALVCGLTDKYVLAILVEWDLENDHPC